MKRQGQVFRMYRKDKDKIFGPISSMESNIGVITVHVLITLMKRRNSLLTHT
jgi:hypothetical protein